MTLYSTLHEETKSLLDDAKASNMKMEMPREGRYFYVHATIAPKSIPFADPEDLLVPGLYQVFVPEEMDDGLAARCAFEAFSCLVPISCIDTIKLAVIDPESGGLMDIDFDADLDGTELGNRCLGFAQYVAMTYNLSPKPYPIGNLYP